MRNLRVFIATALVLAGCETYQPQSYSEITVKPRTETIDCAIGYVNTLGYTVTDVSRDSGFVRGEKKTSGGAEVTAAVFGAGFNKYDQITVSVFTDPTTGKGQIRTTATTLDERVNVFSHGNRTPNQPSESAVRDSKAILRVCGKGEDADQPTKNMLARASLSDMTSTTSDSGAVVSFSIKNLNTFTLSDVVVQCDVNGRRTNVSNEELRTGVSAGRSRMFRGVIIGGGQRGDVATACRIIQAAPPPVNVYFAPQP